jgi:peptidoglycan/LPS O-acetylase OafA/YrhL
MIALASFALIAHTYLNPEGVVGKMLCFRPLAWLGRISYGVYLYHIVVRNTVMSWLHTDSEHKAFVVGMPITLLLSWLSFTYYEAPIIAWGRRRAERLGQAPDGSDAIASGTAGFILSRKAAETGPRYADANSGAPADTRRPAAVLPDYIGSEGV